MTRAQLLSAGADGLLKLWSVRNGECLSTFDEHEGKVRLFIAPTHAWQNPQPTGRLDLAS